jgi:predicted HTH transcriptional regulator
VENIVGSKDNLYEFLVQNPTRESFRTFIKDNTGEQNHIDFKGEWIEKGTLAKIFLSMANFGGGIIIFGIKEENDDLNFTGLNELKDKATIDNMISKYISKELDYTVHDLSYDSAEYNKLIGKKFQVIHIKNRPERLPFISLAETNGLEKDVIYIRRGTKCVKACAEEITQIINSMIKTKYKSDTHLSLEEHLSQIKVLFSEIPKTKEVVDKIIKSKLSESGLSQVFSGMLSAIVDTKIYKTIPNDKYPKEDYETFIARMIEEKKLKIEKILDLK